MEKLHRLRREGSKSPSVDNRAHERMLAAAGYSRVAGLDEAGRGCIAGPVVAAAVILGPWYHEDITDSKLLSPTKREKLAAQIKENALAWSVGVLSEVEIDRINIYQAAKTAMIDAASSLEPAPDFLLIDAMKLDGSTPFESLVKGELHSVSIAAASILAKVTRDAIMLEMDSVHPLYGFARHKGYCTKEHVAMLEAYGPCALHRKTFAPVRQYYES